jgi:CMP-N,N'-diacetyllegionaminic acid synthase
LSVVGLIPAREGSKGLPRKNLAPLAGKPLVTWAIEVSEASDSIDRTVVSTDSEEIATLARELAVDVLGRPPELAADDTPMLDVVLHALRELSGTEVLVLLQPTSPLRRAEHVDEAVRLLRETGADSVVSVVEVPHQFTPNSLMELREGRLTPLVAATVTRRQDKPTLYARNGPAVLVLRADRVGSPEGLYGGDCRPYVMDARDSIDVDGPLELELAEALLRTT